MSVVMGFLALLGLVAAFVGGPLYVMQLRHVRRGPEYVPMWLIASAFVFAFGLVLIGGVVIWLIAS